MGVVANDGLAAVLALTTAYVRVLGVAIGASETFAGPMAKQHRMAVVTIACALAALETIFALPHRAMTIALIVVVLGCIVTIARRLKLIARDLNSSSTR